MTELVECRIKTESGGKGLMGKTWVRVAILVLKTEREREREHLNLSDLQSVRTPYRK